jgi:DNA-binding XRE family transcriptional regulator
MDTQNQNWRQGITPSNGVLVQFGLLYLFGVAVERFTPREALILGRTIARLRKEQQWSQATLAEKLDLGLRHVQKLEQGIHSPSLGLLIRLRKTFKIEWAELLNKL